MKALALALLALAQDRPAAPPVSPEVLADRRVTFRVRAPQAQKAQFNGEWAGGSKPMEKDDQGVWSVTVGPLEPDVWSYSFTIDGVTLPDP